MEGDKKHKSRGTYNDAVVLEIALITYFFQVWTKYLKMYVSHAILYRQREKTEKEFPPKKITLWHY